MSIRFVPVAVALLVAPGVARGQRLDWVGGGAGLVAPAGSFGDVEKIGWHVGAAGVGTLRGPFGFVVSAVHLQTAHRDDVPGRSTIAGATANVAWYLGGEGGRVRPFVMAGLGGFRVKVSVTGYGSAGATKLGLGWGGGVLLGGAPRRVFVMAQYVTVQTTPQRTAFVPVTAGVLFPLGGR